MTFESRPEGCGKAVPFALLLFDSANALTDVDLDELRAAVMRLGINCHDVLALGPSVLSHPVL